jgi:hypothetical protein
LSVAVFFALLLLSLLVAAAGGAGRLLLRPVRSWHHPLEKAVFCTAVGMGAVAFLVFALGLLRALTPVALWAVLLSGAVLGGVFVLRKAGRGRRGAARRFPFRASPPRCCSFRWRP